MDELTFGRIVSHWDETLDTWQGDRGWTGMVPENPYTYPPMEGVLKRKAGYTWRPLPPEVSEQARTYIRSLTERYPLQLRGMLGLPMWFRFVDVWSDTGDPIKAMRAI